VGVRDVVAELRAFAAKITFLCHDLLQYQSRVAELPENKPYEERLWKRRAGGINRRPIRIKSCQGDTSAVLLYHLDHLGGNFVRGDVTRIPGQDALQGVAE
jgi:hypothetical protein